MANNLGGVVDKYTQRLDAILEHETKTADLNLNSELVGEFSGNGKIEIATIAMDGLGDYSRANGFPAGDVDLSWDPYQLKHDRGREFSIDALDDEERELIVSANVMAEFARTKVVPEVDAIRFATLAANAGTTASAALTSSTIEDALLAAEAAISEKTDLEGTILYMTTTVKNLLRKALPYRIAEGENPNGKFETFDDMKIVTVPANRFYSAIDLYDGTTSGETDGGYVKHVSTGQSDAAGVGINFLMVNPKACAAIQKHEKLRYFSPDVNQDKDAHKWQYRLFHDLLVYANKTKMIYAHLATS